MLWAMQEMEKQLREATDRHNKEKAEMRREMRNKQKESTHLHKQLVHAHTALAQQVEEIKHLKKMLKERNQTLHMLETNLASQAERYMNDVGNLKDSNAVLAHERAEGLLLLKVCGEWIHYLCVK